jgi:citrate synthase
MENRLEEIMSRDPLVVRPSERLNQAAAEMQARSVGAAVVVEDTRVVGILTERDLARAAAEGADPSGAAVATWMTAAPLTMAPSDEPTHALDRMLDRHFRHIPVCEADRLVGIVSLRRLTRAASLGRVDPWRPGTRRGLENVTVGTTRLSHIDGARGRLVLAGHDATELALRRAFEDVWALLHTGALPTDDSFARRMGELRGGAIDPALLAAIARSGGPLMLQLQAAVAATGALWSLAPWHERDPEEAADETLRVAAILPVLVAALWRLGRGLAPVAPDPSLSHTVDYLRMLHGEMPDADPVRGLERYLILTAEHGMNASTFAARVIASTGADVAAAVTGAAGAFGGPLHGGAPSLVLDMLDDIGSTDRVDSWLDAALASGRRLMGFGHRVYRAEDPRAACLRQTASELGGQRIALARLVEEKALARLRAAKPNRALYTNVEFWAAIVLERVGVPRELFTPTFAVARVAGWTAHVLEQVRDNRLIRPTADYVGPPLAT